MTKEHRLGHDFVALALLALVVFLFLSLASYSPSDPVADMVSPLRLVYEPDRLVFAPALRDTPPVAANLCGRWGALVADALFTGLGLGAYYAVVSLALADVSLLRRQPLAAPVMRSVGWLASLVGLAALLELSVPQWTPGPVIGAGGYLGALTGRLMQQHFAGGGGLILCGSLFVGGCLLFAEAAWLRGARSAASLTASGLARGGGKAWSLRNAWLRKPGAATATTPRRPVEQAEQDGQRAPKQSGGLSILIRGKAVAARSQRDEDPEELEYEEDGYEASEDPQDGQWEEDEWEEDETGAYVDDEAEDDDPGAAQAGVVADPGPRVVRRSKPSGSAGAALNPPRAPIDERQSVMASLDAADHAPPEEIDDYELPNVHLLEESDEIDFDRQAKEVRRKAKVLEKTFADFGYKVKVVEIETGPVIAQYEVALEAGLRLSKITGLADDLAIALRAPAVRIVAPIPGKNTVGIEVPNEQQQTVRLREVIEESQERAAKMRIPLFLGKDVSGSSLTVDLAKMPHLLIAGRTGTGKSVCLNAIISSILMTRRPDEVRMLMIDPKMVELSGYGRLPHLMHPVVTDMKKAEAILAWAVDKMEERYALLARAGVRHLTSFNQLGDEELRRRLRPECEEDWEQIPKHLPFIVIVADELADLMMTSGKEVEQHIIRLAQKSRAVGIHLILATQKPTVDVITGLIKSNLPARISFQVASRTDSRVVLDEMGAEKLLGNGDMLFLWPGTSTVLRGQGTYLSDEEIEAIVEAVSTGEQNFVNELVNIQVDAEPGSGASLGASSKRDELYDTAVEIVINEGRGSVSLLQRCLSIGYGRAARLIDFMAEDGVVGPYNGSQAREVVITHADWERMRGSEPPSAALPAPPSAPPAPPASAHAVPEKQRAAKIPTARSAAAGRVDEDEDEDDAARPPAKKRRVIRLGENEPWNPDDDEPDAAPATRRRSPAVGAAPLDAFSSPSLRGPGCEQDQYEADDEELPGEEVGEADDEEVEYEEAEYEEDEYEEDEYEEAEDECEEGEYEEEEYEEEEYEEAEDEEAEDEEVEDEEVEDEEVEDEEVEDEYEEEEYEEDYGEDEEAEYEADQEEEEDVKEGPVIRRRDAGAQPPKRPR